MSYQDVQYTSAKYADVILPLLQNSEQQTIKGVQLNCCCPFHEDTKPSFGINLETGAFNCFSCEAKGSIVDFLAKMNNISNEQARKELVEIIGEDVPSNAIPYTLEDYAQAKKLNIEHLKQWQVHTAENNASVAIPYFDENSQLVRTRYRNALDNNVRFYWGNNGESTTLYGLWALNKYHEDYIILVERRK